MATAFLDLTGLGEYHSKLKAIAVGSISISGKTVTIKALDGTTLGTATTKDTTYSNATQSVAGLMSKTDKVKLDGIAEGATLVAQSATNGHVSINGTSTKVYTHPTYTAHDGALYKVTVDGTGHVSVATAVTKSDITALGIPASDTTYDVATQSADGLMSAADKTTLDNLVAGGGEPNVIEAVKVKTASGTSTLPVASKAVTVDLSGYAVAADVASAVKWKGQVQKYSDLPTNASTGDMYNVLAADASVPLNAGDNVVWNGSSWDVLAGLVEIASITTAEIDALFT